MVHREDKSHFNYAHSHESLFLIGIILEEA